MAESSITVISNSSPLIVLAAVHKLELLRQIFQEVFIPDAVYKEVVLQGGKKPGVHPVADAYWIIKSPVKDKKAVKNLREKYHLGQGEAEAIILAHQLQADWIILDELRGRKAATDRGLNIIGTLGIILLAKDKGLVENVRELLEELMQAGFHLSKMTYKEIIDKAGED